MLRKGEEERKIKKGGGNEREALRWQRGRGGLACLMPQKEGGGTMVLVFSIKRGKGGEEGGKHDKSSKESATGLTVREEKGIPQRGPWSEREPPIFISLWRREKEKERRAGLPKKQEEESQTLMPPPRGEGRGGGGTAFRQKKKKRTARFFGGKTGKGEGNTTQRDARGD